MASAQTGFTQERDDLLEALPYCVLLVDSNHRILYVNEVGSREFALDPRVVLGGFCPQVVHQRDQPCEGCPLEASIASGSVQERELFDAGSGRWLRLSVYPTGRRTPEGTAVWLHLVQDVSAERRLAEERDFLHRVEQVVSRLLRIGLEPLPLDEQLGRMLELVLAVPWLGLTPRGAVFLADDDRTLELRVSRGLQSAVLESCGRVPSGRCLCGRAAREGLVQFAATVDERHETRYPGMEPHGHYCLPILAGGRLLGVLCLYVAEQHLRSEREERFLVSATDVMASVIQHQRALALFEQAAVGVAQIETESGRIVRINQKCAEILGRPREELVGRPIQELSHPDDLLLTLQKLSELRSGAIGAFTLEQRILRREGEIIWVNLTVSPLSRGGTASRQVVILEDVTPRKRAESLLRESEERFRSLFDTMTEGVALHELVLDAGGTPVDYRILDVNAAFTVHTGISRPDAIGKLASQVYGVGEAPYLQTYVRVATTGEPDRFEVHFEPMHTYFRISVFSPGKNQFATVFEDITGRKRMELALALSNATLQAQNEELDAFGHTVAHDLKTPLSVVSGYAELLHQWIRKNAVPPAVGRAAAAIVQSGKKMARIIDGLLLLSQARRTAVPIEPLDMAAIVAASLRGLEELIAERRFEIALPGSWPPALGHAPWVEQVWSNYIGNAIRHGGEPPRAELGAREQDGMVELWIRDNGEGLSREEQSRLFVPFSRSPETRGTGHGLGLSIVRRIVEKMGGVAKVESGGPGTGCTFSFSLPRTR